MARATASSFVCGFIFQFPAMNGLRASSATDDVGVEKKAGEKAVVEAKRRVARMVNFMVKLGVAVSRSGSILEEREGPWGQKCEH